MKKNARPNCNCTNCDRSCYRNDSGVKRHYTSKKEALRRLAELKALVSEVSHDQSST